MTPEAPLEPPPAVAEEVIAAEEETEEIDELSEQLAVHSIMSEERHDQIIGEVRECQTRLEALSSRLEANQNPDSPALHQILQQVSELRAEMATLKSSLDSTPSNQIPPESTPPIQAREESERDGPREARPAPAPRKRRRIL
jgi:DNA repair exonuclease SbcCD ATPase subunit